MGAGIHVVADERETIGGEALADDAKQALADGLGDPRIDAVGKDVVEAAERSVEFDEVARMEADIGAAAAPGGRASLRDRLFGEIDADELGPGRAASAMLMRLTPSPQPISSTREAQNGANGARTGRRTRR